MALEQGQPAPEFTLPSDDEKDVSLSDFKGQVLVVYFYPKDSTPGCTREACGFRDNFNRMKAKNIAVVGVSKDSVKSHQNFKAKQELNFPLLSDKDGTMCEDYGAGTKKKNYGREYMGIQRSTFLIDKNGKIVRVWPKVKVDGHVDEVLEEAEKLA